MNTYFLIKAVFAIILSIFYLLQAIATWKENRFDEKLFILRMIFLVVAMK